MKLYEILKQTTWADVEKSLAIHYPKVFDNIKEFKKVYFKLHNLIPYIDNDDDTQIVVENNDDMGFDVVGFSKKENMIYSLTYLKWGEWLGLDIHPDTLRLPKEDIIAHCLVDMTFVSFSESDIEEEINYILDVYNNFKAEDDT